MFKVSNILDYVRPALDYKVFNANGVLLTKHEKFIKNWLHNKFKEWEFEDYKAWVKNIRIVGSIGSLQYTSKTDVDIHVEIDWECFKDTEVPDLTDEEALEEVWTFLRAVNSKPQSTLPETKHPLELFLETGKTKPNIESSYDIETKTWVIPPKSLDVKFDINEKFPELFKDIDNVIQEIDVEKGKIKRQIKSIEDLQEVINAWDGNNKKIFKEKIDTKLSLIESEIEEIIGIGKEVIQDRQKSYKSDSKENLIFKYMQMYGYIALSRELENILENINPKDSIIEEKIPQIKEIIKECSNNDKVLQIANEIQKKYSNCNFGDCMDASDDLFLALKKSGFNPVIHEGFFEVDKEPGNELPSEKKNGVNYIEHTWVELVGENKPIDITASQFNDYLDNKHQMPSVFYDNDSKTRYITVKTYKSTTKKSFLNHIMTKCSSVVESRIPGILDKTMRDAYMSLINLTLSNKYLISKLSMLHKIPNNISLQVSDIDNMLKKGYIELTVQETEKLIVINLVAQNKETLLRKESMLKALSTISNIKKTSKNKIEINIISSLDKLISEKYNYNEFINKFIFGRKIKVSNIESVDNVKENDAIEFVENGKAVAIGKVNFIDKELGIVYVTYKVPSINSDIIQGEYNISEFTSLIKNDNIRVLTKESQFLPTLSLNMPDITYNPKMEIISPDNEAFKYDKIPTMFDARVTEVLKEKKLNKRKFIKKSNEEHICSYCDEVFNVIESDENIKSHGICPKCVNKPIEELDNIAINKRRKFSNNHPTTWEIPEPMTPLHTTLEINTDPGLVWQDTSSDYESKPSGLESVKQYSVAPFKNKLLPLLRNKRKMFPKQSI